MKPTLTGKRAMENVRTMLTKPVEDVLRDDSARTYLFRVAGSCQEVGVVVSLNLTGRIDFFDIL